MAEHVLLRRGKTLLRRPRRISLAGDGLLERMRSTTFALLGITAAMALGLVAIAAQQVWPELPFSPLPGPAAKHGEIHNALVVAQPGGNKIGSAQPAGRSGAAAVAGPGDGAGTDKSGSRLSESRQLEVPVAGEEPAVESPAGHEAPAPSDAAQPPAGGPPTATPTLTPTPTAGPAPTPSAPTVSSPSTSKPVAVSTTKDLDQGKDDDKGRAYGKQKTPGGGKGGKPRKDNASGYSQAKASAPPVPAVVESGEYAGEDKAEEDKDDSPTSVGKDHGHAFGHDGK
jgi:hypothetical protein